LEPFFITGGNFRCKKFLTATFEARLDYNILYFCLFEKINYVINMKFSIETNFSACLNCVTFLRNLEKKISTFKFLNASLFIHLSLIKILFAIYWPFYYNLVVVKSKLGTCSASFRVILLMKLQSIILNLNTNTQLFLF